VLKLSHFSFEFTDEGIELRSSDQIWTLVFDFTSLSRCLHINNIVRICMTVGLFSDYFPNLVDFY